MGPYTKRRIALFVVYPVAGVLFGILGFVIHWMLALLLIPLALAVGYYSTTIQCPNCKTPVGWHRFNMFGFTFHGWSPITPKKCERCGHDLR